jgi:hypothetical protein
MKKYRAWRYSSNFIDLGTRWRWVVSLTPGRFTPGERDRGTQCIGAWVGSRAPKLISSPYYYIFEKQGREISSAKLDILS